MPPAGGEKCFKFSIAICISCVGKMLISVHFRGIMELLLNNYLRHSLIIEKTFLFIEIAIKPAPVLHPNVQMPWRTECNRSNWRRPECFYEPESPVTTPKSGQSKLPIRNIPVHAGSDKSKSHGRTSVFYKACRLLHNYE